MEDVVKQMMNKTMPSDVKLAVYNCPLPNPVSQDDKISSSFIGNSTSIQELFKRINEQFSKLFHSKTYLHWYTCAGMEESEFKEAGNAIKSLISEYKQQQEVMTDDEDEEEDADDE